jgi:hypothetical protein
MEFTECLLYSSNYHDVCSTRKQSYQMDRSQRSVTRRGGNLISDKNDLAKKAGSESTVLLFNNQLATSLGGHGSSVWFSEDQKERAMVTDIGWRKTLAPEARLTLLRDEGRLRRYKLSCRAATDVSPQDKSVRLISVTVRQRYIHECFHQSSSPQTHSLEAYPGMCPARVWAAVSVILAEVFRGFPQSFHANTGIVHGWRHDSVLENPLLDVSRGSVVGWSTMLQAGRSRVRGQWIFQFT